MAEILLITPPFTQLNTPYPATAYLKGFLNTKNISSYQIDLGLEVMLQVLSKKGIENIVALLTTKKELQPNAALFLAQQNRYLNTVDTAISFLQGNNNTLAYSIANRSLLPEGSRFAEMQTSDWAFGQMGITDKAKYIATLFLEDINDVIVDNIDAHFGFSRYAEKLARCANEFDDLYAALQQPNTFIDNFTQAILQQHIIEKQPQLIVFTAPFPGNVYSAFKCGAYIKNNFKNIPIAFGGGFANTELRHVADARVFEFIDFVCLDDGEKPMEQLWNYVQQKVELQELKRTFVPIQGGVHYINNTTCTDYKQADVGTPDYTDLPLHKYVSVLEVLNPMHSLWSNGRWNKLTMAHGCYWGKCTFCDTSLPYISDYEPIAASTIVDRMETIIAQTSTTGFHFVDEAAPPALMVALAAEIIKRNLVVNWWTNVRFEKSFTRDVCMLLKASGCIGVSGGLEVASDRLLQLIDKGITIEQVSHVNKHFVQAGIMVHAYLMFGYPTQTEQETIDSLEIVRQMFEQGVLQSAFWHQFALTTHSPIGLNPKAYNITIDNTALGTFANNDLDFTDVTKIDHNKFSFGLKKSLFNYMQGIGLDSNLQSWFESKIPKPTIAKDAISSYLNTPLLTTPKQNSKLHFLGKIINTELITQSKKGNTRTLIKINFVYQSNTLSIQLPQAEGEWLVQLLHNYTEPISYSTVAILYTTAGLEDFDLFWFNKPINTLWKAGVLVV